jgi:hypothetical protein
MADWNATQWTCVAIVFVILVFIAADFMQHLRGR